MDIEIRNPWHPDDAKHYTTDRMRNDFLIQDLFIPLSADSWLSSVQYFSCGWLSL